MDLKSKLAVLADAAKYDASCASSGSKRSNPGNKIGHTNGSGICHSYTPDGRCISLLKILLTNHCIYDCQYCINRVSSDVPRARFTPEEVVYLTIEFYRRNYIEGLFLSSGVIQSPDHTMELVTQVARSLREDHAFNGYIHLKTSPGASSAAIAAAGRYADRLSCNIELPTPADLQQLAPEKKSEVIEHTMHEIKTGIDAAKAEKRVARSGTPGRGDVVVAQPGNSGLGALLSSAPRPISSPPTFAPAGQSTQLLVGATPTADGQILRTSSNLYERHRLRRVYYSAYSPIPHADSRLPPQRPPLVREHRLYQADWLMRFYGFNVNEIAPDTNAQLDLTIDPKLAWALTHREQFPVDLNRAHREQILRVPGIGVRSVARILKLRRIRKVTLADLVKLRLSLTKVRPFVLVADHNPDARHIDRLNLRQRVAPRYHQLELFESADSARTGEV